MPQAWRPSPTVRISFAVHAGAALGVLLASGDWPWALGALAANQALLTAAGLLPRSTLLGANLLR
jgi:hypothetical protein